MTPEAIILYLEANGITVTGNTDQYFRLSPDGIKQWSVKEVSAPTETALAPYETQVINEEASKAETKAALAELEKLDRQSIRDIREWIAKQADAPATLVESENKAKAERAKVK